MQSKQQKKGQRWIVLTFLVVAVVGLAGVSFVPVFSQLFSESQSQPVPSATSTLDSRQKELQDLEKSYGIVLAREPENINVLESLVDTRVQMISLGLKKPADLVEPLKTLVRLSPERVAYRVALGQSQQESGDLSGASESFRAVLAQEPNNVRALQGLVAVLLQEKRPQVAIDVLQTTLASAKQANQLKPGTVDELAINLILAQVYVEQKNYDLSLSLYDELIKASPKDFRPFYYKAIALRSQGNAEEAQTFFQSAIALAPEQQKEQIRAVAAQGVVPSPAPSASPVPSTPSAE